MGRRQGAAIGLGVAVAAGAGAGLAVLRQTRAWRAADEASGPDPLDLPDGEATTVTTGDGAHLAVTVAGQGRLSFWPAALPTQDGCGLPLPAD